jgi:hydroxymethylpyrimidine/phosphomethylpyrimidine kinase
MNDRKSIRRNSPGQYPRVLTIAGSDSGGGAGIQADLKTFAANGCYGMSVITALTAQNTRGVYGIHPVPAEFVKEQIDAVMQDIGADAVKIGMLFSAELIRTVADRLRVYNVSKIVLDPVMVAQSGDRLLQAEAIDAIKSELLPLALVVTPNLPEAEVLTDTKINSAEAMFTAARQMAQIGSQAVLIKAGHLEGTADSTDLLYLSAQDRFIELGGKRIATRNNHGTGCTLSSAIAAHLAQGKELASAVRTAKNYIQGALEAGADYKLGGGHGPVHHFFEYWH